MARHCRHVRPGTAALLPPWRDAALPHRASRVGGDRRGAATTTVITLPEGVGPGAIIGRGGERIRELRRATGASVVVNATHRTVEVKGSAEQVQDAVAAVFALVRDAHDARSAFISARPDQAPAAPNTTTEVFSLPEGVGPGAIIGRGGDRICELRRSTGARVLVNASDRTVEVRGTVEQVRAAEAALSALVHQARQSRTVFSPPKRISLLASEFDEGLRFVHVTDDSNGVDLRWFTLVPSRSQMAVYPAETADSSGSSSGHSADGDGSRSGALRPWSKVDPAFGELASIAATSTTDGAWALEASLGKTYFPAVDDRDADIDLQLSAVVDAATDPTRGVSQFHRRLTRRQIDKVEAFLLHHTFHAVGASTNLAYLQVAEDSSSRQFLLTLVSPAAAAATAAGTVAEADAAAVDRRPKCNADLAFLTVSTSRDVETRFNLRSVVELSVPEQASLTTLGSSFAWAGDASAVVSSPESDDQLHRSGLTWKHVRTVNESVWKRQSTGGDHYRVVVQHVTSDKDVSAKGGGRRGAGYGSAMDSSDIGEKSALDDDVDDAADAMGSSAATWYEVRVSLETSSMDAMESLSTTDIGRLYDFADALAAFACDKN